MDPVAALLMVGHGVVPDGVRLEQLLGAAGWPAELTRNTPQTGVALRWMSEDGLNLLRITGPRPAPEGALVFSPRMANRSLVVEGGPCLQVVFESGSVDRMVADLEFLKILAAILEVLGAVAVRVEHRSTWHGADDVLRLVGQGSEVEWPGELLMDLHPGPLGPDSLAVLSDGLNRYGLNEVMVVGDRQSLPQAWEVALELLDDRMMDAEPAVDLQQAPHPTRPQAVVDVAFVDGAEP